MKLVIAARVASLASRCGECWAPGISWVLVGVWTLLQDMNLLVGAVGIGGALQAQNRHADVGEQTGDVEVAKARVQPGVVPSTERGVDIAMVARQALSQVPVS